MIVSGNVQLLGKTPQFPDRPHPFLDPTLELKDIIRGDIHPDMAFSLKDGTTGKIIQTSEEFWSQFRNRIPGIHPLSLNPSI